MRYLQKNAGFVLVELIIVTVILGAIFPLSIYFIDAMKATRETKIQQTANHLAQEYMEDYKQMPLDVLLGLFEKEDEEFKEGQLEAIPRTVNGRNYNLEVSAKQFLVSEIEENWIGGLEIEKKESSIEGSVEFIATLRSNSKTLTNSVSLDQIEGGQEYLLEIEKDGRKIKLSYVPKGDDDNFVNDGSVYFDFDLSEENVEEPRFSLLLKDNPSLILNVENKLGRKLIINKAEVLPENETTNFTLNVKEGQVVIQDDFYVQGYRRGLHLAVTVKNEANEVLAEVGQTRFIEW